MEKLLAQIQKVYDDCVSRLDAIKRDQADTAAVKEKTKESLARAKEKEKNLDEREGRIEKIEDLIQYEKDSKLRMDQADELIKAYDEKVNSFNKYEGARKKELEGIENKLNKKAADIENREMNLENIIVDKVRRTIKEGK